MATIVVNGQEIQIPDGARMNLIEAARLAGVEIPHYCYHPGLSVVASCRMCLVEVGQRDADGNVRMLPKLVPACATPAQDGTVVVTNSEKVRSAEALVEELLLLDHPVDCPICDQAGECYLQDYYYKYGRRERRAPAEPFTSRRKDVGQFVTLFIDRCVMCSRCVRFTREVSGTGELAVVKRGNRAIIDVFPGQELNNPLSGNTVDICPVGALCSKPFLYKQRVWFLRTHRSICTLCATGCAVLVDQNMNRVYRLRPRFNPNANDWWMCDYGRFGFDFVYDPRRLLRPGTRGDDSEPSATDWEVVLESLATRVRRAAQEGKPVGVLLSPFLSCEDAYLACTWFREVAPAARFYLGPVPVEGEDERFPKRPLGAIGGGTESRPRFVISGEKCPNARGVRLVIEHFQERAQEVADFVADLDRDGAGFVYIAGGYPQPWGDELAGVLEKADYVVVHDLFPGPLTEKADLVLPMAVWFERAGSYVNRNGVLQCTERAVVPRGEARSVGRVMWSLLGRSGLYRAEDVLQELALAVPAFAPAGAISDYPEHGIPLQSVHVAAGEEPAEV